MKRFGYIYEKIYDKENIRVAILKASKGKRRRRDVRKVLANIDKYIDEIHELLRTESFLPSDYIMGEVQEGVARKKRIIYKPNFYPDQVIHWAIMLQVSPIFKRGMYEFTCGSIPNRGVHYGKKYIERWVADRKNTKYYLKMDISKFYPSVDTGLLNQKLATVIKDDKVLAIIRLILSKEKGLPIGILVSQWFANFFLQDLDHYIKEQLKAKYYIRYMDDMIVFGGNKRELHKMRIAISNQLSELNLKMKDNWQVCRLDDEPLDFMGFRFYRQKTTIRKSIMHRITRKVRRAFKSKAISFHTACGIISYLGWIKHSDSHWLFVKWIQPYINIFKLKSIVSNHMRLEATT